MVMMNHSLTKLIGVRESNKCFRVIRSLEETKPSIEVKIRVNKLAGEEITKVAEVKN